MPWAANIWCVKCRSAQPKGHRCAGQVAYDRQRGSSTDRGYDAAWRAKRLEALRRDGWRCVLCGWEPDIVSQCKAHGVAVIEQAVVAELRHRWNAGSQWLEVDHIETVESRPELRLDLGNLRTLCRSCHSARTLAESISR